MRKSSIIPYEMFDLERTADEARRASKLRHIYHHGQDLAWDGQEVLPALLAKHGGIHVSAPVRDAIGRIYSLILWGELAAWRISAQLADDIVPLEAKMAATSQAHDEARHFYVMHDYLEALGYTPRRMDRRSEKLLELVMVEKDLTKKLLGMQLMVESIALAIFRATRESQVEPVLTELLEYYEKDEARHVGLGVQYLPDRLKHLGPASLPGMIAFEVQLIFWALAALSAIEKDLAVLGIPAGTMIVHAMEKQQQARDQMWASLGQTRRPVESAMRRLILTACGAWFPPKDQPRDLAGRFASARAVWRTGEYRAA